MLEQPLFAVSPRIPLAVLAALDTGLRPEVLDELHRVLLVLVQRHLEEDDPGAVQVDVLSTAVPLADVAVTLVHQLRDEL